MVFFVTWYWMMSVKCEDNKTNFMVSEKEDRATTTFFANCWEGCDLVGPGGPGGPGGLGVPGGPVGPGGPGGQG